RGVFYERLRIVNYGRERLCAPLEIHVDADFADIFEVRGTTRRQRGRRLDTVRLPHGIALPYVGLDQVTRRLRVEWSPDPDAREGDGCRWDLALAPGAHLELRIAFACEVGDSRPDVDSRDEVFSALAGERRQSRSGACEITTSN